MLLRVTFLLLVAVLVTTATDVLELQGTNFELTLTTYKYLAVLFYDASPTGRKYRDNWALAAENIGRLPADCEMAQIPGDDPELGELIDAYQISVPSIRVFRRGIMGDYRGPLDSVGIANYILEDAQPSVRTVSSIDEMRQALSGSLRTVVFSLFNEEDLREEDSAEGYSISAWGQYQAAADSLRGHASFYVASAAELVQSLQLTSQDLPAVYMVSNEEEGILKYAGEILELNLSEWVLKNSSPAMGELTVDTTSGELYTTQFFSSRKLKFILFLTPAQLDSAVLQAWEHVASTFFKQAIFSYLTHPVADVVEYFDVAFPQQAPLVAAHLPASDAKFKSAPLRALDSATLFEFVAGVITGKTEKIIKSEPVPKLTGLPPLVQTVVGSNVREIVSVPGKDVLLLVYTPLCAQCKQLIPAFDVLGRAVQGESRIVLAKINAAANDIPASWGVKGHPMLLWFRAADKEGNGDVSTAPIPRSYWDAGYSLQELAGFVQRQGSFDPRTLKVASSEQLMSLQGDEAVLREKYEVEERHQMRNKDRAVYEAPLLDFLAGEIVFDGTRAHVLLVCVLGAACVAMGAYIILLKLSAAAGAPVRVTKRKDS